MSNEQIKALNQIIAIIDDKASRYKNEVYDLNRAQRIVEKKLLNDLIDDGLNIANSINPKPLDIIDDLNKLRRQLSDIS